MKSKLIFSLVLVLIVAGCGGRSGARNAAAQQNYESVEEGSAAGVTSTILGPGETLPPITETSADSTTAFALNASALPPPAAASALPPALPPPMTSAAGPAITPAPKPQIQQPAPPQAEPEPVKEPVTEPAPATTTTQEQPKEEEPPPPPAEETSGEQAEEPPPPPQTLAIY